MTIDSFISFLTQSDWLFLTGLILLLGIAFAGTFSEKPGQDRPSRSNRAHPR